MLQVIWRWIEWATHSKLLYITPQIFSHPSTSSYHSKVSSKRERGGVLNAQGDACLGVGQQQMKRGWRGISTQPPKLVVILLETEFSELPTWVRNFYASVRGRTENSFQNLHPRAGTSEGEWKWDSGPFIGTSSSRLELPTPADFFPKTVVVQVKKVRLSRVVSILNKHFDIFRSSICIPHNSTVFLNSNSNQKIEIKDII
jgi:hypothetical protein